MHVLVDPFLANYDVVFKLDSDIQFKSTPPQNPVKTMVRKGCIMAHTHISNGLRDTSCNEGGDKALYRFSALGNVSSPLSGTREWCKTPQYFYGNLMGYTTSYMFSPMNAILSTWLYECHDGFFKKRWGDQPPMTLYMCQQHDIVNISNSPLVCDFSAWRNTYFTHKKK